MAVESLDLSALAARMRAETGGVGVEDRRYLMTTYPAVFIGAEAVQWMMHENVVETAADAVNIGNLMVQEGLFHHVTRDHDFKNEYLFYRFQEDEPAHGSKARSKDGNVVSWSDFASNVAVLGVHHTQADTPESDGEDDVGAAAAAAAAPAASSSSSSADRVSVNPVHLEVSPLDEHNVKLLDNVHPQEWEEPTPDGVYDVVAIGAGAGGLVTCAGSAGLGAKCAIIEDQLMGGDCLNIGCVPSKALLKCANVAHLVRNSSEYGVRLNGAEVSVDFGAIMERMRRLRAQIAPNDSAERFAGLGVDVFLGRGRFTSPNTVEVNGKQLQFRRAVVATGGRAFVPPIPGLKDTPYLTNGTLFNLTELPERLVIIGSGPIGCEMAQAFARFGSKVTVLEAMPKLLPREDEDAAEVIRQSLMEDGVEFVFSASIQQVSHTPAENPAAEGPDVHGEFRITYRVPAGGEGDGDGAEGKAEEEETVVLCNAVLISAGRRPNVNGIGLEEAGVQFDERRGVKVSDSLRTTNRNIFAVGDCCTQYQFTHVADYTARCVIRNALFPTADSRFSGLTIPWCTYTEPEVAHVGEYPRDLEAKGIHFNTFRKEFMHNDRCILEGTQKGFLKIHTQAGSDKILGATIVGANAGDLISEISVAMHAKCGLGAIASVIHPYPTRADIIRASGDAYNKTRLTPTVKTFLRNVISAQR